MKLFSAVLRISLDWLVQLHMAVEISNALVPQQGELGVGFGFQAMWVFEMVDCSMSQALMSV